MLSKLKLYGDLAEFCGGINEHSAVINQPIDAIRYLRANFAGVDKHIASQNYQVYIGEHIIDEELLDFPSGGIDIKIVPVVAGAGNNGKIIALGKYKELDRLISPNTQIINLSGAMMTPGIIEGHGHFYGLGLAEMQLDLSATETYQAVSYTHLTLPTKA